MRGIWTRRAGLADLEEIASIQRGQGIPWPEYPGDAKAMAEADARRDPGRYCARWVGGFGGRVEGFLSCIETRPYNGLRAFNVNTAVRAEARGRGLGKALFSAFMEETKNLEGWLCADVFSTHPGGMGFLEGLGFRETWRETPVELDVARCDTSSLPGLLARLAAEGIAIRTVFDLARDEGRDRKLHELYWSLSQLVPSEEDYVWQKQDFEEWKAEQLEDPSTLLEAYLVAVRGEDYLGLKEVGRLPGADSIACGLMGVLPEWQHRGIALAMQLATVDYAKRAGCARLASCTATCNLPMQGLYARVGYRKLYEWAQYMRELRV